MWVYLQIMMWTFLMISSAFFRILGKYSHLIPLFSEDVPIAVCDIYRLSSVPILKWCISDAKLILPTIVCKSCFYETISRVKLVKFRLVCGDVFVFNAGSERSVRVSGFAFRNRRSPHSAATTCAVVVQPLQLQHVHCAVVQTPMQGWNTSHLVTSPVDSFSSNLTLC